MSLLPSRPVGDVERSLAQRGFEPASPGSAQPWEVELCTRLTCQKCGEHGLECRAYSRLTPSGQEVAAVGVCPRCESAERLPGSGFTLFLRRLDEHSTATAVVLFVGMGAILGASSAVPGQTAKIVVALTILLPIALLAYLARNGPGGGDGGAVIGP